MTSGGVWNGGTTESYHDNQCKVVMQRDGNLVVNTLVAPNPYYQYYRPAWTSGTGSNSHSDTYYATLDEYDGSLKVFRDEDPSDIVLYSSNIPNPVPETDHGLYINEECVLVLRRGDKVVWQNNHWGGLGGNHNADDFLQKGEMTNMKVCEYNQKGECIWVLHTLMLQHDCNLVQFEGRDYSGKLENNRVIWASHSRRTDVDDCYLYCDEDRPRIYEGTLDRTLDQFDPRAGVVLWDGDVSFSHECGGGYEVLLKGDGGLEGSC